MSEFEKKKIITNKNRNFTRVRVLTIYHLQPVINK